MYKGLELHAGDCGHRLADILQAHLASHVDAADTLALPETGAVQVDGIGLGGEVQFTLGRDVAQQFDHPRVGHDIGIEGERRHALQVLFQGRHHFIARIAVDRQVGLYPPAVTEIQRRPHLRQGKVVGHVAQAKGVSAQIDRVSAIVQGNFQFFHVAGRSQQFEFVQGSFRFGLVIYWDGDASI